MQFLDDIAHQIHVVGTTGSIVADGAGHPVVQGLVDDADWQHSVLPRIDVWVIQHNAVTVKSVYQDVFVPLLIIIADNRHRVAILFDAVIQQLELRRGNGVGIVCIWLDLFHRNCGHVIHGASKPHFESPPVCILPSARLSAVSVPALGQIP